MCIRDSVNSGAFRAIGLNAPEASIVDVRGDAPAGAHGEVRKRAVSVMLGALAQVIPEAVSGDLSGTSFPNSIGGYSDARGRPYVYIEVPAGGMVDFMRQMVPVLSSMLILVRSARFIMLNHWKVICLCRFEVACYGRIQAERESVAVGWGCGASFVFARGKRFIQCWEIVRSSRPLGSTAVVQHSN